MKTKWRLQEGASAMPAIRSYAPDDQDHLVEIWERASRVGHPFLTEQDLQEQKILVREVYLPSTENWVAFGSGKPLGFIGLIENFVGGLFVDPGAHKLGIGRSLIEHAAARKGVLQVEVYAKNDAALGFYQHMGFFEQGRRPVDDQGRELELVRLERAPQE
jgi:putative acetyltransferase